MVGVVPPGVTEGVGVPVGPVGIGVGVDVDPPGVGVIVGVTWLAAHSGVLRVIPEPGQPAPT